MILMISRLPAHLLTALLAAYWLALLVGTHWPHPSAGGMVVVSDKTMHLVAYAGLGLLLACATAAYRPLTGRIYLLLAAVVLVYGVLDELAQIPIPGREAEFRDWVADAVGVVLGLTVHRLGCAAWSCFTRARAARP